MSKLNVRFKAFVAKRRNAMVVLGSLIVFVTFVTNEAIRDNLKDYIDSLHQAQSTFLLQRDHAAILLEIEATNRKEFESEQFQPVAGQSSPSALNLQTQRFQHEATLFGEFGREFMRLGRSFLGLGSLLDNAPGDHFVGSEAATGLIALEQREEDLNREIHRAAGLLQQEGACLEQGNLPSATESSRQLRASFSDIQSKTDDYSNAMDEFSRVQYNAVKSMTDDLDSFYQIVKLTSYVLYVIGWSFALLGKLYGAELIGE
jgi:hypothetical protein